MNVEWLNEDIRFIALAGGHHRGKYINKGDVISAPRHFAFNTRTGFPEGIGKHDAATWLKAEKEDDLKFVQQAPSKGKKDAELV